jgi:hypothetical protein
MKEICAAKAKRIGGNTADLLPPRAEKTPRQQVGRKAGTKDSSERKARSTEQEKFLAGGGGAAAHEDLATAKRKRAAPVYLLNEQAGKES